VIRAARWIALALLAGCAPAPAHAAEPAAPVPKQQLKYVKATPVKTTSKDSYTGQLFPSKLLPMGFEVGGRLAVSRVSKGDLVKAGQPLGSLDTEIIDAQVAQAQAGVEAAEAGAAMATDVAGRQEKLKDEGSVSDVQSRGAVTQSKQAQAQLLMAKAQLAQAQAGRRKHDLRALFPGTVIDAPDNVGGMVGPGMPVYIVMQLDPLTLKTTIPENVRAAVKPGLKVHVESIGSTAATEDAVVKVVINSADPATRRIPVEITVPNADGRFVANTLARTTLPLGEERQAYLIPSTALGTTGGEHVFTVDSGGALKRVPVTVLERTATQATIATPEKLGDLVDFPTSALVDGTRVTQR